MVPGASSPARAMASPRATTSWTPSLEGHGPAGHQGGVLAQAVAGAGGGGEAEALDGVEDDQAQDEGGQLGVGRRGSAPPSAPRGGGTRRRARPRPRLRRRPPRRGGRPMSRPMPDRCDPCPGKVNTNTAYDVSVRRGMLVGGMRAHWAHSVARPAGVWSDFGGPLPTGGTTSRGGWGFLGRFPCVACLPRAVAAVRPAAYRRYEEGRRRSFAGGLWAGRRAGPVRGAVRGRTMRRRPPRVARVWGVGEARGVARSRGVADGVTALPHLASSGGTPSSVPWYDWCRTRATPTDHWGVAAASIRNRRVSNGRCKP